MKRIKRGNFRDYVKGLGLGLMGALLLSFVFYDFDPVSLWLVILPIPAGILYKSKLEMKRKEQALLEFRDGLSYVKNALDAGDSAENAFGSAVLPLRKMYGEKACVTVAFQEICRKVQNGKPLETAFLEFANQIEIQDIEDFADIFPVLKRSGGDMNVFVSREIGNLTDKQSLKRDLNIVTAGKRNEFHIMCLIPIVIIIYLKLVSAELMKGLYHQMKGYIFMTAMLFLYIVCIVGGEWILKKRLK